MRSFFLKDQTAVQSFLYDKKRVYGRVVGFAKFSVLLNAALALGKFGVGIYSLSIFLCINGFYNVGIGAAKAMSLKVHYDNLKNKEERTEHEYSKAEYRSYFIVGLIILATSLVYMLYCVRLFTGHSSTVVYQKWVAIGIAAVSFYEIGSAISGVISTRRDKEPVMEAIKLTSLVSSFISMVLTQTALMSFTQGGDISFSCGLSGIFFGSLSMLVGVYMIIRVKWMLKKYKREEAKNI